MTYRSDAGKALSVLREALDLLGPHGEHWTKGTYEDSDGNYCALGAITKATYGFVYPDPGYQYIGLDRAHTFQDVRLYLCRALPPGDGWKSIAKFNDFSETTFEDVRQLFERAIQLAEIDLIKANKKYRVALYSTLPHGLECMVYKPTLREAAMAAESWNTTGRPLLFKEDHLAEVWRAEGEDGLFLIQAVDR